MSLRKIYIAGPDVFWPNALAAGAAKTQLCADYGFDGLFPLDCALQLEALSPREAGMAIYRANIELMQRADLMIANMTPFRGASLDAGTAFELGFMTGLGKPVWGYSLDGRLYADRVASDGADLDAEGLSIERFDMADNLMLIGAIEECGAQLLTHQAEDSLDQHLHQFEQVLQRITRAA
ncbi:nucleoside 2-deoxyribosyltransferase [Marinobacterium rhizophilum]|uniref:Nucleoside 2-deoxyribosyltransferase n=1 Tax=Marinobacterium rhizophilum TaxID=420402 RepID=A0ABY5HG41_9GAMM|nr:nucleoside 2-deoxyribosyltransferase [Marinobacterium rhizophilum]UTW11325.1 nucleoside 2-deoxyribosyltransferase [Marinobacterium rhizophilum]